MEDAFEMTTSKNDPTRIAFLYSAPLVQIDTHGRPHSIDELDFDNEWTSITDRITSTGKPVEIWRDNATTENLRTAATRGCCILHYSGHGAPDFLAFEDGRGAMHAVCPEQIRDLCSAGGG